MRTPRTVVGLVVLTLLVGVLGYRLWSRGMGLRLGAPATTLAGPHTTEAQWAAAQVIADMAELLTYAKVPTPVDGKNGVKPKTVPVTVTQASPRLQAQVALTARFQAVDVDGGDGVWSAATYAPIADAFLRELDLLPGEPVPAGPPDPTTVRFTARLLEADAPALERESERLGAMLGAGMRRADLHEAAAFLVMGLALRESSDRMHDDRPQLLRMLAHLAIARALRGSAPPTFAGAAASAYADQLAGRGRDAAQALETLAATAQGADAAWVRVLRTRIDDDWRRLAKPDSHVERLEYFRARLVTLRTTPVFAELEDLAAADHPDGASESGPRDPAYGRIVRTDFLRVDGADVATDGLDEELREVSDVWRATHGGATPADPVAALDGGRIGAMTAGGPRPLPWGLWSRFFERHLVAYAVQIDRLQRESYSNTREAEREGADLDAKLGGLDLYPGATSFRLRGVANGDADLRLIDQAIRVAIRRPEIVPAHLWGWLEYGQQYEPVAKGMPTGAKWFAKPAPRVAAVDLGERLASIGHALSAAELEALWQEAPSDFRVAEVGMARRFVTDRTADQVKSVFGPRVEYDLRVRRHVAATLKAPADRVPLLEGDCRLDVEACFALGATLVDAGRETDAVAAYERALTDPRVGALMMANNVTWLTDYYGRHGKVARALAIANEAAHTGAARGVYARASLYESLDRLDEAEDDYISLARRYGDDDYRVGFYYRMARERKLARYEARLQEALGTLFPRGLQPVGPADARQAPAAAVQVTKDSPLSRQHGVRAGDLIVGFDGWRVENLKQYQAVRQFSNGRRMQLVLWRGARVDVDATVENRWLNMDLRSYPIHGWAE